MKAAMRTIGVSVAAIFFLPLAAVAQETDFSKVEIKVTHDAWSAKYTNDFVTADIFIETLYNSLTHQQHTPFVKHN
jgi:hypothetical protein